MRSRCVLPQGLAVRFQEGIGNPTGLRYDQILDLTVHVDALCDDFLNVADVYQNCTTGA